MCRDTSKAIYMRWNNRSYNWVKLSGNIDLTGVPGEDHDDEGEDDDDEYECMWNIFIN